MTPEQVPAELVAMLDADAGKAHATQGPVLASLARILTRHEQQLREQVAADLLSWCEEHDRAFVSIDTIGQIVVGRPLS